jgi:hypothetical protein
VDIPLVIPLFGSILVGSIHATKYNPGYEYKYTSTVTCTFHDVKDWERAFVTSVTITKRIIGDNGDKRPEMEFANGDTVSVAAIPRPLGFEQGVQVGAGINVAGYQDLRDLAD